MSTQPSVTVVTATRGCKHLRQAAKSVAQQTYPNLKHWIIVDGADVAEKAASVLADPDWEPRHELIVWPHQTGAGGFNGHRIYGAASFLVNTPYISFLDDDNWFDPIHIDSLVESLNSESSIWVYSLRKIVDQDGEFVTNDDCESLGVWRAFTENYNHVDTSCYLLPTNLAVQFAHIWYRRFREQGMMSPDMELCKQLLKTNFAPSCSKVYTVNYRLGSTPQSVKKEFFLYGNSLMSARYPRVFPWQ